MRSKNLILIVSWLAFAGVVSIVSGQATGDFRSISKAEIELLLQDMAKSNPMVLKRLAEDPEMRKAQLDSLERLLAFASQAQTEGLADDPTNRRELENIRSEVTAVNYDREINKNKGKMPPFGFISEVRVKAFWTASPTAKGRQIEFQKFIDSKIALLKAGNPGDKEHEFSDEEREQARDFFAKVKIYDNEFNARRPGLPKTVRDKVALQVKLQQAQFLSRLYTERMASQTKATDGEIERYISRYSELFDISAKKAKAEQILMRAKAGEDFAKLANEFSEDPGNIGPNGIMLGGIYRDIPKGKMVPQFESTAISLQPGQVYPSVVETDFGYHVIKLEKKNSTGDLYDARHILISTDVTDPADPDADAKPIKTFVRTRIETEKEDQLTELIIVENNIQIPDDFTVPEIKSTTAVRKPAAKRTTSKRKPVVKKRS